MRYKALDKTDLALIQMLQEDGDCSQNAMQAGLSARGLTPLNNSKLSERRRGLIDSGYISIKAIPDYRQLGFTIKKLVKIQIARIAGMSLEDTAKDFIQRVQSGFPTVLEFYEIGGDWAFLLVVIARDSDHFQEIHSGLIGLRAVSNADTVEIIKDCTKLAGVERFY